VDLLAALYQLLLITRSYYRFRRRYFTKGALPAQAFCLEGTKQFRERYTSIGESDFKPEYIQNLDDWSCRYKFTAFQAQFA
jgi:hypothetical protein